MRLTRWSVLALSVTSLVLIPIASAGAACPGAQSGDDRTALGLSLEEPLFTPVTDEKGVSGLRSSDRKADPFCEWFDITCSNGETEECCGSVESCLIFCVQTCGEPCIYVET